MPPFGTGIIPRGSGNIRKSSSSYRWINLTEECKNCNFKVKDKQCSLGGITRNLFTKGNIHKKCHPKLKNIKKV